MPFHRPFVLVSLAVLVGCGGFSRVMPPGRAVLEPALLAQRQEEGCGAESLERLRGAHFTRLAEVSLRGQLRVLSPQQRITRDLMPDRLNVQVDGTGQILKMFCG